MGSQLHLKSIIRFFVQYALRRTVFIFMEKTKRKFKISIQLKTSIIITLFALFLGTIAIVFFYRVIYRTDNDHTKATAQNISATVAETIDVDKYVVVKDKIQSILDTIENPVFSDDWGSPEWNDYIAQFDSVQVECATEFNHLLNSLSKAVEKTTIDVDCIYLVFVDIRTQGFVYVIDSAGEDGCPPGCIDPIYDINKEVLTNPDRGFPPYITNTAEYGWLCTAGTPIYNGDTVVGYAMVDISMTTMRAIQSRNVLQMGLYVLGTIVILWVIGFVLIHFILIKPIRNLTNAAKKYVSTEDNQDSEIFAKLNIKTKDEVEELANAMGEMEKDINRQINELKDMNVKLIETKQEANLMTELANKDGLTGVRNKISYDSTVKDLSEKINSGAKVHFGIAMIDLNDLKVVNDECGHSAGDIALMKLSSVICGVFVHSPVFRVGGDEFVVLLQNNDYRRIDKLVEEFDKKISDLQNDEYLRDFEKISAAIGYAKYNPEIDKTVQDVFNRADEAMYNKKREMKNQQE